MGLSTDTGYEFEDSFSPLSFTGLDLLLCGDIHKRQVFELPEVVKQIKEAKELLDLGILTQAEYDELIKKLKPIILNN